MPAGHESYPDPKTMKLWRRLQSMYPNGEPAGCAVLGRVTDGFNEHRTAFAS